MAHFSQEKKASLSPRIKEILKKFGLKGSLSVNHHSTLVLNIKSGGIDFISNFNETVSQRPGGFRNGSKAEKYLSVNEYWFQEHFTGKAKEFLEEMVEAMKGPGYFNNDDMQSDFYSRSHYIDINVGGWNKPYTLNK